MRNNKEFHVQEREENQLKGIEVDLMRVRCKLQTFWHSGNSSRPFFPMQSHKNFNTNRLESYLTCVLQKEEVSLLDLLRGTYWVFKNDPIHGDTNLIHLSELSQRQMAAGDLITKMRK